MKREPVQVGTGRNENSSAHQIPGEKEEKHVNERVCVCVRAGGQKEKSLSHTQSHLLIYFLGFLMSEVSLQSVEVGAQLSEGVTPGLPPP